MIIKQLQSYLMILYTVQGEVAHRRAVRQVGCSADVRGGRERGRRIAGIRLAEGTYSTAIPHNARATFIQRTRMQRFLKTI